MLSGILGYLYLFRYLLKKNFYYVGHRQGLLIFRVRGYTCLKLLICTMRNLWSSKDEEFLDCHPENLHHFLYVLAPTYTALIVPESWISSSSILLRSLSVSIYSSSLMVAHLSDVSRRQLVVTRDSARIQDETTEKSCRSLSVVAACWRDLKCPKSATSAQQDRDKHSEICTNSFPHSDTFWRPWETSLLKTLWEKEKLLVTSIFSFSHSVFYQFG